MRKIFLKWIFGLFKKVKHDKELQGHIEINWRFSLGGGGHGPHLVLSPLTAKTKRAN
jgi:hypothetical protein